MVERNYFSHTTPGGVSFVDRIMRQDYVDPGQGWTLGENLAWGSYQLATPEVDRPVVDAQPRPPGEHPEPALPRDRDRRRGGRPGAGVESAATYATSFGTRF